MSKRFFIVALMSCYVRMWYLAILVHTAFAFAVGKVFGGVYKIDHLSSSVKLLNVVSVFDSPLSNPACISLSLILMHTSWGLIIVATILWGRSDLYKNNVPHMSGWAALKLLCYSFLMSIAAVFVALTFDGESLYFGDFFYNHEFSYLLAVAATWLMALWSVIGVNFVISNKI